MNSCFIVGHIDEMPVNDTSSVNTRCLMKVSCNRSYAEADGTYVQDVFSVLLWRGVAEETCNCCNRGDPIAVKGRLIMENNKPLIVAEQVSLPAGF